MHIIYFLTFDYSLATWENSGHLERELKYFDELINKYNCKITIVSYGTKKFRSELKLNKNINVIEVYDHIKFHEKRVVRYANSIKIPLLIKRLIGSSFDLIKQNQLQGSLVTIIFKIITKKPLFIRTGYDVFEFAKKNNKKKSRLLLIFLYQQISLLLADIYTVSSFSDLNNLKKFFKTKKNLHYLPNWVLVPEFVPYQERSKNDIFSVGRLENQKNLRLLIDKLKNTQLNSIHIGDGSLKKSLLEHAKKIGVEFKLKEPVNNSYLINEYSKYIFYASPSYFEGNSKTILEAMAAGCIVLASDIENNRELIRDNENGFLLPLKNFEISKIIENLSKDLDRAAEIGASARNTILENFSLDKLLNQEYELLKKIV